ncbi:hypothetical protein WMF18_37290 [Sorangium sp. So ce315]|uniref:hypothetical protein n=1 Tax=Sorangium sp. So ce315 TaxID=3133299 RepID=UPI003F5F9715
MSAPYARPGEIALAAHGGGRRSPASGAGQRASGAALEAAQPGQGASGAGLSR